MEYKKLTDKIFDNARDYVPLLEKTAFVNECAGNCFDRMEVKLSSGEHIPYYKENVERRQRYLMGGFVTLYLGLKIEPVDADKGEKYLLSADDYDRWAGGHIFNQIERVKAKGGSARDKAFDLVSDFRDLEKMLKTEIYGMLQAMNDPVTRFQEQAAAAMTPQALQDTADEMKELREMMEAYAAARNGKRGG